MYTFVVGKSRGGSELDPKVELLGFLLLSDKP